MGSIPVTLVIFFKSTRYEIFPSSKVLNYKVNIKALKVARKKDFRQRLLLKVKGPFFKKKNTKKRLNPIFLNNDILSYNTPLRERVFKLTTKTLNATNQTRTLYNRPKPLFIKVNNSKAPDLRFQVGSLPYTNEVNLNFTKSHYSN
jgi:hypothetical protein